MNFQKLKKNIKILSEKFNCEVSYFEDYIQIKNDENFIELKEQKKDEVLLKYNVEKGFDEFSILKIYIYDALINIFYRQSLECVNLNQGDLLNIEDLKFEFGNLNGIQEKIKELKLKNIDFYDFGGNRVLTQYYKGVVILIDDLCINKSNVINLNYDQI